MDAITELVRRSKQHVELLKFHRFHEANPQVVDFLVSEIRLRIANGFDTFSYHSLWSYARWQLETQAGPGATFKMNDHDALFYSRAITVLHPEFNGRCEFRKCRADFVLGLRIEPLRRKSAKGYSRLEWKDGTSLEAGWRPSEPHVVAAPMNLKRHIHTR